MKIVKFIPCSVEGIPQGIGWYYTRWSPETGEGEGWFGAENEPDYFFEDVIEENADGDLCMASYTKGIGEGCFWTRQHEIPLGLIGTRENDDESFIEIGLPQSHWL